MGLEALLDATGTVAEPSDALLAEIAQGRMPEGFGSQSRRGGEGRGEDAGGSQEIGGDGGERLPVWVASGLIVLGTQIAFRRDRPAKPAQGRGLAGPRRPRERGEQEGEVGRQP